MTNETFGQRLARLRKEKELTQADLASRLNVTAQAVSKWENDQASPDIDILIHLSEIFEITLDELLGRQKQVVSYQEKPSKKDIDKMFFRIRILSKEDGATVNVNLPLALVRVFVNKDTGEVPMLQGNKALENVDFRKIIELVEEGAFGEIVNITTDDGDKVSIFVE